MKIKLDSYTLPERVKANMIITLFRTHQKKKELGFTLCSNPNNIIVAKGDITGTSDRIEIDSSLCEKDEKFLGGYHTHYSRDSYASADDLHYCGVLKTICTGGSTDNKIRCNTWKHGPLSQEEYNNMIDKFSKDITKSENPVQQANFNCIRDIVPLYLEEKRIKNRVDIDLNEKLSRLDDLRRRGAPGHIIIEEENMLANDTERRNRSVRELVKKIRDESKRYYNEVEIT